MTPALTEVGYRVPVACHTAGITYRNADYWDRTGVVAPSIQAATGSGSRRLYSVADIVSLAIVKRLLEAGFGLPTIRVLIGAAVACPHGRLDVQVTDEVRIVVDLDRIRERVGEALAGHVAEDVSCSFPQLRAVPS